MSKIEKLRKQCVWKVNCKEWCYECCWVIMFNKEEKTLLRKELLRNWYKVPPQWKWPNMCEYLTIEWRCSVYNQRPIICRIFWLIDNQKCRCDLIKQEKTIKETDDMIKYSKECMKEWFFNEATERILNNLKNDMKI